MKKLTKKQRHDIYVMMFKAIQDFHNGNHIDFPGIDVVVGFCYILRFDALSIWPIEDFPELMKHKPDVNQFHDFWFHRDEIGYVRRLFIVLQAIKETK